MCRLCNFIEEAFLYKWAAPPRLSAAVAAPRQRVPQSPRHSAVHSFKPCVILVYVVGATLYVLAVKRAAPRARRSRVEERSMKKKQSVCVKRAFL